jgi:predicted amidohydrolase YtcJ
MDATVEDPHRPPDLVLFGGRVLTLDRRGTAATAVAVRDGRVLAVGGEREIIGLAGERTRRHDLAGRTAIPGFVETHTHPYFFGLTLDAVDAGSPPNDSIDDVVERVAQACREAPSGEWVVGYRYDDTLLREGRHPTRHDLDPVSRNHPVLLVHISGHFATVNSVALRLAGERPAADPTVEDSLETDSGKAVHDLLVADRLAEAREAVAALPIAARLAGARSWQVLIVLYVISAVLAGIAVGAGEAEG